MNRTFIKHFTSLIKHETLATNKKISIITLNNPQKRNALSFEMLTELKNEITNINNNYQNGKSSLVILSAEGNVYSSGHDLKQINSSTEVKQKEIFAHAEEVCLSIRNSKSIFIAEVFGLAAAAGCQLSSACDLTIASNLSAFSCPGIKVGLYCSTPGVPLSRLVSPKQAMHLLLTGDTIDAQKAYEWGLISSIISVNSGKDYLEQREILRKATLEYAEKISKYSSQSLSLGKETFYKQLEMPISDSYNYASKAMAKNLTFEDCKEGISSFIEKRKPNFKH